MNYDPHEDYYVLLGVPDTAPPAAIKAAYRARILHAHPDKATGNTATAAALNRAWEVLGDPRTRAAYDAARRRYLAAVAAAAAASATKARPATRAMRKVRTRAAAPVAPKVSRKAAPRAAAPPAPNAVDVAVENFVGSLRNAEYGKALGWFILGAFISDASRPQPTRRRARRRR